MHGRLAAGGAGAGEERDAPGAEILTACIAAMECAARIGLAADYGFHRRGFHATGIAGHFSSALAAGRLMGLDAAALASAQGVCVSTAASSREFWSDGAWNKRLHPGWAAEAGITAAGLAGAGFKGCERPYDGRFGLFRMLMGEKADAVDFSLLADGLGERWELLESASSPSRPAITPMRSSTAPSRSAANSASSPMTSPALRCWCMRT